MLILIPFFCSLFFLRTWNLNFQISHHWPPSVCQMKIRINKSETTAIFLKCHWKMIGKKLLKFGWLYERGKMFSLIFAVDINFFSFIKIRFFIYLFCKELVDSKLFNIISYHWLPSVCQMNIRINKSETITILKCRWKIIGKKLLKFEWF